MRKITRGEFLSLGALLGGATTLRPSDVAAATTAPDASPLQARGAGIEADLIVINAIVYTQDADLPRAEAFELPDIIRTATNLVPEDVKEVRIVDIVGLDQQADGGTHVASTAAVGRIAVVKVENKGKGFRRLRIAIGEE